MGLDNWGGEKNATAVNQKDNAYVPKAEHDRLQKLEEYRSAWAKIENDDWKGIKEFIDHHISCSTFEEFMLTAEKKTNGVVTFRMSPETYFQSQLIQGAMDHKSLGNLISSLIDMVYKNQKKLNSK